MKYIIFITIIAVVAIILFFIYTDITPFHLGYSSIHPETSIGFYKFHIFAYESQNGYVTDINIIQYYGGIIDFIKYIFGLYDLPIKEI